MFNLKKRLTIKIIALVVIHAFIFTSSAVAYPTLGKVSKGERYLRVMATDQTTARTEIKGELTNPTVEELLGLQDGTLWRRCGENELEYIGGNVKGITWKIVIGEDGIERAKPGPSGGLVERFYPTDSLYLSQLRETDIRGKTFLVRVDYNVPMDKETGEITDDSRIRAPIETINLIRLNGGKVVLMSHLGRPKGKVVEELRLNKVAERLQKLLGIPVTKFGEIINTDIEGYVKEIMNPGEVVLLENVRFSPGDEAGDEAFAQRLAGLADYFVNDAFGAAHRGKHASVGVLSKYVPGMKGLLFEKEEKGLAPALEPERPFVAFLGGAKVSDKIGMIEELWEKLDKMFIGGGMANAFLKAKGYNIGASTVEDEDVKTARRLLAKDEEGVREGKERKLVLPVDLIVADSFTENAQWQEVPVDEVPDGWYIMDIGQKTKMQHFSDKLIQLKPKTIIWNGNMGVSEWKQFADGTFKVAACIAALTKKDCKSIICGGNTAEVVGKFGLKDRMTFVSSGGGAAIEYIAGQGKFPELHLAKAADFFAARNNQVAEAKELNHVNVTHRLPKKKSISPTPDEVALQKMAEVERRPVIGGNWKMAPGSVPEAVELLQGVAKEVGDIEGVDIVVYAPFTALEFLVAALKQLEDKGELPEGGIHIGAQNLHAVAGSEESVAFTGEISSRMLAESGITHVVLGHSERRRISESPESSKSVNLKVMAALNYGLTPVVCIGESLDEREAGLTEGIVETQLKKSLENIEASDMSQVIIAYEPVWAIGTGKTATPGEANKTIGFIRGVLADMFGVEVASQIRIQYGGSVKDENTTSLITQPHIDGFLVGGASLKAETFAPIVKQTADYAVEKEIKKWVSIEPNINVALNTNNILGEQAFIVHQELFRNNPILGLGMLNAIRQLAGKNARFIFAGEPGKEKAFYRAVKKTTKGAVDLEGKFDGVVSSEENAGNVLKDIKSRFEKVEKVEAVGPRKWVQVYRNVQKPEGIETCIAVVCQIEDKKNSYSQGLAGFLVGLEALNEGVLSKEDKARLYQEVLVSEDNFFVIESEKMGENQAAFENYRKVLESE